MTDEKKKELKRLYFYKGLTIFLVVVACLLFYFLIEKIPYVFNGIKKIVAVFQPVIFGLIIAYVLNPVYSFFTNKLTLLFHKQAKKGKKIKKTSSVIRAISVFLSVLFFLCIIFLLTYLIVPQFITSVSNMITVLPGQIDAWSNRLTHLMKNHKWLEQIVERVIQYEKNWLKNDLSGFINRMASQFASGIWNVITFLKNIAFGLVFTVYLLFHKERFIRLSRKALYVVFSPKSVSRILDFGRKTNEIFSAFISGRLVDAAIIGLICFLGCTILRIPYPMLIAIIVGTTNVIPIFGPYLGGVPSGLLIFLTSPIKCLYFVIFIILLQMLDGNVIAPKILGSSIGIESFWVVFSIVVGGGLFGFVGMLIGVPTFAVIYYLICTNANRHLKRKKLPVDAMFYDDEVVRKITKEGVVILPEEGVNQHEDEKTS
ncbi:MAG: AI-2E family transporter [Clostridia bacterium]|nr:AI-2E family transporter [Clostridia bacterium]